jgi:hypothetical protein
MSKEDQELLRAVREWRPPTTLHPIAMTAWEIYERYKQDLPPEAMTELRAAMDSYGDDLKRLAEASEGMIRFMLLLNEHLKDEANGKKVMELLRTYADRFEPFWRKVAEALEREGGAKLDTFKGFLGAVEDKSQVAKVGAKPPPGSVPLSSMLQPGRPPPWAKKGPGNK